MDQADSSRRPHRPQASSPASRYRRTACPAGPRGAAVSWAAMKSASLTSAACGGMPGDDPAFGQVPPLHLPVPQGAVSRVGQVEVGALPVPHLPTGVAGVRQYRGDGAQRPRCARAVRVPARVCCGRARHPGIVQRPGDPRGAVPGQPLREHPRDDRRGRRVGFEAVRAPAPRGVRLVRVRPRITEPVPVRRTPAQVPALLPGLGGHRGPDPDPGPGDLPLGRQAEREHGLLVVLGVPVHPPADLRHPQRDAVVLEQRRHRRVLTAVERPLVLPDHDRVPPAIRVCELRDQGGGLRAPRPRQHPALPRVEELRRDHPAPGYEHHRLLQLPGPRRHRVLPVLGRDPPVERESQAAPAAHLTSAAGQALRPRR